MEDAWSFVVDVVSIDVLGHFLGKETDQSPETVSAQGEDGRSCPYFPRQQVSSSLITLGTTPGITHGIVHAPWPYTCNFSEASGVVRVLSLEYTRRVFFYSNTHAHKHAAGPKVRCVFFNSNTHAHTKHAAGPKVRRVFLNSNTRAHT